MDMGHMSHGSPGGFRATNEALAHAYWYMIAGFVGLLAVLRLARKWESHQRRKQHQKDPRCVSSRPREIISQAFATATAAAREMVYPQPIVFSGRISKFFTPLPLGRWILLLVYWTVLLSFLWTDVILGEDDPMYAYRWEKVGFRAAWISIAQVPFIYLLSCKFNPISLLTGISYERFNWLHRWAARTIFLTVIVHWAFFFHQWYMAGIVELSIQMLPMIKYGFGAWAVMGWMSLSGFGYFRSLCYELFVVQHICAAAFLLWLLYVHVPAYGQYFIWISVGFLVFDWGARVLVGIVGNFHLLEQPRLRAPGHIVHLEPLAGDTVRLTIDDPSFTWRAGQHVYLSVPRLRPFEMHPFTIASICHTKAPQEGRRLSMVIQAQSGFSRSLRKAASKDRSTYRAFLSGPWGTPPELSHYDSVVMIAGSSGASFTVPLLQELSQNPGCVRQIIFHWVVRSQDHFSWFADELTALLEASRRHKPRIRIVVHVTNPAHAETAIDTNFKTATHALQSARFNESSSSSSIDKEGEKAPLSPSPECTRGFDSGSISCSSPGGRPSIESLIRPPVEAARGETAIVVCGGTSITAQARTFVAALSDERAVHKGTGAQGVFLYTETYGW